MRNQSLAISEEDGVGRRLSWFLEKCSTMKQRTALILHCRFYNFTLQILQCVVLRSTNSAAHCSKCINKSRKFTSVAAMMIVGSFVAIRTESVQSSGNSIRSPHSNRLQAAVQKAIFELPKRSNLADKLPVTWRTSTTHCQTETNARIAYSPE